MPALSAELKKAIVQLDPKEKDKVLLREVAKNKLLIDQLSFKLLEEGTTTEFRRDEIQETMNAYFPKASKYPGYVLAELKDFQKQINWHVKVTKDTYGDLDLGINLVLDTIKHRPFFFDRANDFASKLIIYLLKRVVFLLKKYEKLDPELKLDFSPRLEQILTECHTLRMLQYWQAEVPLPKSID
jgi:hypothetical protein